MLSNLPIITVSVINKEKSSPSASSFIFFILNSLNGIPFFIKDFTSEFFCAFFTTLNFFLFKKLVESCEWLTLIVSLDFEFKLKILKTLSFGPSS